MVGGDGRVLVVVNQSNEKHHSGNPSVIFQEELSPSALGTTVVIHDDNEVKDTSNCFKSIAGYNT